MKIRNGPKAFGSSSVSICQSKSKLTDRGRRGVAEVLGGRKESVSYHLAASLGSEMFTFWWRLIKRDKCQGRCEPGGDGRRMRNY